ncbi:TonB-dependent receptor [Elongatibacter sediminis]|uniref:TonB-dependent receptor n=1 Tax=Elongatibacter sediminis TaxID=3119006 RepID=A0AAW9R6B9_9GAMM
MKSSLKSLSTHTPTYRPARNRLTLALLPALAAMAAGPGTAWAQDQEQGADGLSIEEVIVTAQRREQNLQDVPIAISAFSANDIEKAMFADVSDYLVQTPNASFISNGARSRRSISIRGITSFAGPGTTGFYIDDFSVSNSTINPPIMDIERIEVLRGPQATYFGRNALGGGLSITTQKPNTDSFSGSAMIDYSRYDTLDMEAVLNVPVVEDTFAMRFNAKSSSSDGNIRNINPIGGGNDHDYDYIRAAVRWTPTDNLTIDASFGYANESVGMREGVPSGVLSFFGAFLYNGTAPIPGVPGPATGDPDGVGFWPDNTNRTNFNTNQDVGTAMRNGVLRVDYEHGDLLFTSITGYINSDFTLAGDIDGSSRDYFNEFRNNQNQSASTEFRVQNTGDSAWHWNAGVIYAEDEGEGWNRTLVGAEQLFGFPEGGIIDRSDTTSKNKYWAVFGQMDYDVNDQWTVSVGGRYSKEKVKENIQGFSGTLVTNLQFSDTFDDFSPRIAATFRATDNMTWYGTISKGYKSGGVQEAPIPEFQTFDPETLWNYEIGLKTDLFDSRVRLNAAVFYMDWEDLQVAFQENYRDENGDFQLFGGVNNAEKATSKGAELSATALVSENLVVNFNVGYLDATFDDFVAVVDSQNYVLDGETIPNSPEWTMSADAEYSFRLTDAVDGWVRLEWVYRDEIEPTVPSVVYAGFPWDVPSYDFFNLRVGLERDNFRIVGYVENLFDEDYYTNAYQKAFAGGLFIEPSYQNYGVRVTYSFE